MEATGTVQTSLGETLGRLAQYLADYGDFLRSLGRFERAGGLPQSPDEWGALADQAREGLGEEELAVVQGVFSQLPEVFARAREATKLSAKDKVDLGDLLDLLGTALRRAVEA